MLKNSSTLVVSVAINISMKLCFVSVNGSREPYLLDEPRTFRSGGGTGNRTTSACLEAKKTGDTQIKFGALSLASDGSCGGSVTIVTSLWAGQRI
jgi:hypothetical protein